MKNLKSSFSGTEGSVAHNLHNLIGLTRLSMLGVPNLGQMSQQSLPPLGLLSSLQRIAPSSASVPNLGLAAGLGSHLINPNLPVRDLQGHFKNQKGISKGHSGTHFGKACSRLGNSRRLTKMCT